MQTSALRYYEREGLLQPAGRSGGRRYFDRRGLLQLAAITYWQEAGLTIAEMARLLNGSDGGIEEMNELAAHRIAELERLIQRATRARVFLAHVRVCVHERLDECPEYRRQLAERAEEITSGALDAVPRFGQMRTI